MAMQVGQLVGQLDTSALNGLMQDAQLDYYGKRVAVASKDSSVHIYDVTEAQQKPAGQVRGHDGPVWKVAWAHPKFGSLLATCGYDMKVYIWKEIPAYSGNWQAAHTDSSHVASVNDVQFCPWEHGLILACASSDGTVSILTYGADHQRKRSSFQAHAGGVQSVSWAPVLQRQREASAGSLPAMRLVTGGCDSSIRVWRSTDGETWTVEMPPLPPAHTDWVRAVAWRPEGVTGAVVASGSWDKTVMIWAQEMEGQPWRLICKLELPGKVEGLAWSLTGSLLAISYGQGESALYREAVNGGYEEIGLVAESGFTEVYNSVPIGTAPDSLRVNAGAQEPHHEEKVAHTSAEYAQQQQSLLASFDMS